MLGLSAGPGILSAHRKRNSQVAVKPQIMYIHTAAALVLYNSKAMSALCKACGKTLPYTSRQREEA